MASAFCPDCGQKIVLGPKPRKGQLISCPHCNADLEIVGINPLELDWALYSDDDDFEDDEDFLDEDEDLWDEDWDDEDFEDDDRDWDDDDEEEL